MTNESTFNDQRKYLRQPSQVSSFFEAIGRVFKIRIKNPV